MNIVYTQGFKKKFERLSEKIQFQFQKRIELFVENPKNQLLQNHPLKGNLAGLRAFSVTGDCRVIYQIIDHSTIKLMNIGTHNQVY